MSPAKHRWIHPTIVLVAIVVMVARIGFIIDVYDLEPDTKRSGR